MGGHKVAMVGIFGDLYLYIYTYWYNQNQRITLPPFGDLICGFATHRTRWCLGGVAVGCCSWWGSPIQNSTAQHDDCPVGSRQLLKFRKQQLYHDMRALVIWLSVKILDPKNSYLTSQHGQWSENSICSSGRLVQFHNLNIRSRCLPGEKPTLNEETLVLSIFCGRWRGWWIVNYSLSSSIIYLLVGFHGIINQWKNVNHQLEFAWGTTKNSYSLEIPYGFPKIPGFSIEHSWQFHKTGNQGAIFQHGSHGRIPQNTICQLIRQEIDDLWDRRAWRKLWCVSWRDILEGYHVCVHMVVICTYLSNKYPYEFKYLCHKTSVVVKYCQLSAISRSIWTCKQRGPTCRCSF